MWEVMCACVGGVCMCMGVLYILLCQSYISLVPRPSIQHVYHLQYNTWNLYDADYDLCWGWFGSGSWDQD